MKKIALTLLAFSGIALACELLGEIVTPVVEVSATDSSAEKLQAIGDKLESWYGNTNLNANVVARVPTKACLLGVCGLSIVTLIDKGCGETFKQAAYRLADETTAYEGGGDGAGGYGDGDGPIFAGGDDPYGNCSVETSRACVGVGGNEAGDIGGGVSGCSTFSELVCPGG